MVHQTTFAKIRNMSLLSVSQIAELSELVYSCVPAGSVMVDNLEELITAAVEAKLRAKIIGNACVGTFVKVSAKLLAEVAVPLPFMPECVEYGAGCTAIKLAGGLFVPCGKSCKPSLNFCTLCTKKANDKGAHEFGTLDQRMDAFEAGNPYQVGDKSELSYGDFLRAKKITQADVKSAIRAAGFSFNVPVRCFAVSAEEPKKRAGRTSKKAQPAAEPDAEADEAPVAPKPKAPRVVLSAEEKRAKFEADLKAQEEKAAQKAAEKAIRDAKKAEDAEAARIKKEAALAEKEAKKAEKAANAEDDAPKKKTKATAAKVQQTLAQLEDDDDAPEIVVSKGVKFALYKSDANKVFAESDSKKRFLLGTYDHAKQNINFNSSDAALAIIAETLEFQIANSSKDVSKFLLNGKVHVFTHDDYFVSLSGKHVYTLHDGVLRPVQDNDDEVDFDD